MKTATIIINSSNYSDQELWKGVQQQNGELFAILYHRYVLQLSNQAFKILQDEELTKDLIQEVFITLYSKREVLAEDLNVGAYLNTTVKNRSLNVLRDKKLKEKHYNNAGTILYQPDTKTPFEITELRTHLYTRIESLQGKCKEVFMLRHFENKSYKEISALLGISPRTVEKHISKAMSLLKSGISSEWRT